MPQNSDVDDTSKGNITVMAAQSPDVPDDPREDGADIGDVELSETRSMQSSRDGDKSSGLNEPRKQKATPLESLENDLTLCKLIRLKGFLISLILFLLASGHAILFVAYTSTKYTLFEKANRPGVWIFAIFFSVCMLLLIRLLWSAKRSALEWVQKHHVLFKPRKKRARTESPSHGLGKYIQMYRDKVGLNGTYYLWRLYLSEFLENWLQLYNMRATYLCTLPMSVNLIFLLCLIVDSSHRAMLMYSHFYTGSLVTVEERNRMIVIDTCLDLLFCCAPLCLVYFRYGIVLSLSEVYFLVLFPTISLMNKLRGTLNENIVQNVDDMAVAYEEAKSATMNRKRRSLFGQDRSDKIAVKQTENFPRWAQFTTFSLSIVYAVFLLVVVIVQWTSGSHDPCEYVVEKNGTVNYYESGCVVKVPFCQNMLRAKCDCASIDIKHHDMVALSDKFVSMTALQRVSIESGPLKQLPKNMENLQSLTYFGIAYSKLEAFNVDILKWKYLVKLSLFFNNISHHHPSVWKHPNVAVLDLNSNIGFGLPSNADELNLPQIYYLHLGNNSSPVPTSLGSTQMPMIKYLFLNGNIFLGGRLPEGFETFVNTVTHLGMARTGLSVFPSTKVWESFSQMRYLDVRGNLISNMSAGIGDWLEDQQIENYFSGNPICEYGHAQSGVYCEKICSEYCWSKASPNNRFCDVTCNSAACNLDGGDCVV